ncbi:PAS domain S-box protein [Maridesulfovibrio ferrireducens]|uniref:PAS domain S-box protein n=1 Tax=Maridesulfovibrio ferrireducens TaxID=246191 RepID=UPI001A2564CC|nr:PAS domain S-box protein [Maridesulfovibrio ferrireducens]MBI9111903.1 PAS domain S-box protein [Maridesulfovibrio ferrireducens]
MTDDLNTNERIHQLEAALAQSENHFRLLFDTIEDAVFMFEILPNGTRGLIRDVNEAACNRLGYTRDEFLKITVEEFSVTETNQPSPSLFENFAQEQKKLFELIHIAKDGRKIPVEISARRFDYEGTPMVLSIVRDISVRKEIEQSQKSYLKQLESEVAERTGELERINEQLKKQVKELEHSRHIQTVLYEIISHAQYSDNLNELLQSIHKIMIKELHADNFFVALIDNDQDSLKFEYCVDKTTPHCSTIENISRLGGKRLSLLPIRRSETVHMSKTQIMRLINKGIIEVCGVIPEVWLGVPLRIRGIPIGVLVIQDYDMPSTYSNEDLQLFAACSDQIALAIERKNHADLSKSARDIFQNIPSGLFIYQYTKPDSLKLLDANPAAENITGITLKDWIGREFLDIWPGFDAQQIFNNFLSPLKTGKDFISNEVLYKDNRLSGAYRVRTFLLQNDKLGIAFEDTTEQKRAELTIRESEEHYRAFFEDNHSVMYILDTADGKILDTNKAAEAYYGYSREELLTMKISDINSLSERQVKKIVKKVTKKTISNIIGRHRLANGEYRNVEIFSGPFEVRGKTRLISIIHDITERLKNEAELSEAKEAAESANKAKDEFLANISHEIRTPLNGVMGMLQLLQIAHLNTEEQSCVDTALQSSRNLLRVLNDVLDFTKIEAGKMDLYEEPFELKELIKQCLDLFKIQAEEKELQLISNIDSSTQNYYVGDEGRIRQILFNLVGNSIKFTESGSITISVFSLPHPTPGKHRLFFSIEDTGVGIPDDKIEHIFDSFTQVDGSLSRKYQGAGLGLSIVKRLVNLIGGNISLQSEVGVGTTILFCVYVEKHDPPVSLQAEVTKEIGKKTPLQILLVEDEKVNRLMALRFLEKMGHNVVCAENGEMCLEELRKQTFDAILMDIQMPVMNGLEATHLIRTSEEFNMHRSVPIIALTAHATNNDRNIAIQTGMNEYISKPFEWELLKKTLYEVTS